MRTVTSACPNCGFHATRQTYDIGGGDELSCVRCEWCWGADGQALHTVDTLLTVVPDDVDSDDPRQRFDDLRRQVEGATAKGVPIGRAEALFLLGLAVGVGGKVRDELARLEREWDQLRGACDRAEAGRAQDRRDLTRRCRLLADIHHVLYPAEGVVEDDEAAAMDFSPLPHDVAGIIAERNLLHLLLDDIATHWKHVTLFDDEGGHEAAIDAALRSARDAGWEGTDE